MAIKVKVKKIESRSKEKQEYKIFNYFKEHTSMLIALISAIIAVITFIMNLTVYMNNLTLLNYWGVEATFVNITIANKVYIVFTGIIYFLIIISQESFLVSTVTSCFQIRKNILCSKLLERETNKKYKKYINHVKKIDKRISKIDLTENNKYELETLNRKIQEKKQFINEYKNHRKKLKISRRKVVLTYGMPFIFSLLICLSMKVIAFICLFALVPSMEHRFLKSLMFSIVYIIFELICLWLMSRFAIKRKVKRILANPNFDIKNELRFSQIELPIEKIFDMNIKRLFRDKVIIMVTLLLVVSLLFISLYLGFMGDFFLSLQKEFYIVSDNNQNYVLIYNDGENLLLEKAIISKDTIIIDTSVQKRVSSENVTLHKCTFKKVCKNS